MLQVVLGFRIHFVDAGWVAEGYSSWFRLSIFCPYVFPHAKWKRI